MTPHAACWPTWMLLGPRPALRLTLHPHHVHNVCITLHRLRHATCTARTQCKRVPQTATFRDSSPSLSIWADTTPKHQTPKHQSPNDVLLFGEVAACCTASGQAACMLQKSSHIVHGGKSDKVLRRSRWWLSEHLPPALGQLPTPLDDLAQSCVLGQQRVRQDDRGRNAFDGRGILNDCG